MDVENGLSGPEEVLGTGPEMNSPFHKDEGLETVVVVVLLVAEVALVEE